jgi:hypothetical protein
VAPPDDTQPTVVSVRPSGSTRDRTPTLTATVRDDRAELSQGNLSFSLDGQERNTFSYDATSDSFTYNSGQLSIGKHVARITATDAAGNTAVAPWTLKVVRR